MYFCGPIHVASYDLCDGSFVLETETMGAQQANNNCCLDIMEVISFLSLPYLHKHQKPKRSSEFLDIPQIWEVSHINVLFTFRRLRMYQVNINLHSRVPNTKTAFLAQLSPQQQFLPISANLILHLIVCDLRPPDQKLLFSILFFFFFPTPISNFNFELFTDSQKQKSQFLSTFIELIVWPAYLRPRPACSFVYRKVAVWARGENRKVASTNVPLSCENAAKKGEETEVEMEDFHNVGGNLKIFIKRNRFPIWATYFMYIVQLQLTNWITFVLETSTKGQVLLLAFFQKPIK